MDRGFRRLATVLGAGWILVSGLLFASLLFDAEGIAPGGGIFVFWSVFGGAAVVWCVVRAAGWVVSAFFGS